MRVRHRGAAEVADTGAAGRRRQHGFNGNAASRIDFAIRAFKRMASRSCGSHHDHSQMTWSRSAVVPDVASSVTRSSRIAA